MIESPNQILNPQSGDQSPTPQPRAEKDPPSRMKYTERFENFKYFGKVIQDEIDIPISSPIKDNFVTHTKAKILFMIVNSLVSSGKRTKACWGIEKSKSDIIILAETKMDKYHQEFKVRGYHLVTQVNRK